MPEFHVQELIKNVAEQMRVALQQKLIPHPGELGTGREEIIREFLRKHLPKRFGVSTGFVFDAHGKSSLQMDIVIYDVYLCPSFEAVGGKTFFPCEAVVAVGQVKSQLTSRKSVIESFDNLRSVKELDRSAGNQNLSLRTQERIDQQKHHLDQIFAFLFVIDRCVVEKTMREALFYYIRDYPRHYWPNLLYYFDHYLITYGCNNGICPNPMDAYAITSMDEHSPEFLLLKFYSILARAIEFTNVSRFAYWQYLNNAQPWEANAYPFDSMPSNVHIPPHMFFRPGDPNYKEPE